MAADVGRKLSELRVCDLKEELEKRKLETTGVKSALIERLQKALEDEGEDPDSFLFSPLEKRNTPSKKSSSIKSESDAEVADEKAKDEEKKSNGNDDEVIEIKDDMLVDEVGTVDNEEFEENEDAQVQDQSNNDNEESINLTIEEDEQKLLHEEAQDLEDKDKTLTDEKPEKSNKEESKESKKEAESSSSSKAASSAKLTKKETDNKKESEKEEKKKDDKGKDEKSPSDKKKDDSEQKSSSKPTSTKDEKEKSTSDTKSKSTSSSSSSSSSRNLWVSGLSSITRASDLKTIFSKFGKVIGAKVVTNTRTPGTRCYGYVTMASSSDATRCIENLHCTELHGRIISVERTKNEIGNANSITANSTSHSSSAPKKKDDEKKKSPSKETKGKVDEDKEKKKDGKDAAKDSKDKETEKDKEKDKPKEKPADAKSSVTPIDDKSDGTEKEKTDAAAVTPAEKTKSETSSSKRTHRSRSPRAVDRRRPERAAADRPRRTSAEREKERVRERIAGERERARQREMLSYQKIRDERERQRLRERERALREEEKRRQDIRRRQREEEDRLAKEREKLAIERERLEREKAELLRLERERQKLERERIELEKLELKRQQMKIIQSSRIEEVKRPIKRSSGERYADAVPERKRPVAADRRFEAPPPPRFDASIASSYERDKKRDDYTSSSTKRDDYSSSKRGEDYAALKRDDYVSSSKRDEYVSSKRDDYVSNKRDDYKREVEIPRHSSSSAVYPSSHKASRYPEPPTSNFRRSAVANPGVVDEPPSYVKKKPISDVKAHRPQDYKSSMMSSSINAPETNTYRNSSSGKRYDVASSYNSERQSGSSASWQTSGHVGGHSGHSHSNHAGPPPMKSFVGNGMSSSSANAPSWQTKSSDDHWRPVESSQDRYDRTYNERSGPYVESSSRPAMYAGSSRPAADRYGGAQIPRYDNGKY